MPRTSLRLSNAQSHSMGQPWLTTWTPEKVAKAPDPALAYAAYVQQVLGVPWATINDMKILRRKIKEVFDHYPHADYYTLCRIVILCRQDRRRFERVWKVIDTFRSYWAKGKLPELTGENRDHNIERRINRALEVETDEDWVRRLAGSLGLDARRRAIEAWEASRA